MLDERNGNVSNNRDGRIGQVRIIREVNLENEALPDGFEARVRLEEIATGEAESGLQQRKRRRSRVRKT